MIETFYQPYLEAAYKDFVHSYLVWFFQVNKFNIMFPNNTTDDDFAAIPRPSFEEKDGIQDFISKFDLTGKSSDIFTLNEKDFEIEKIKLLIRKTAEVLRKTQIDNGSEANPSEDKIKKYFEDKIKEVLSAPISGEGSGIAIPKTDYNPEDLIYKGFKGTDRAFDYYRGIGTERFLKPYIDNKDIADEDKKDQVEKSTKYLKDAFKEKERDPEITGKMSIIRPVNTIPKNAILRLALLIDIILDGI